MTDHFRHPTGTPAAGAGEERRATDHLGQPEARASGDEAASASRRRSSRAALAAVSVAALVREAEHART